jgi:signal transduction histidine kinase
VTPTLAQVLNTLAHEIRTPLAVSRGYLKLLLEGGLPSAADQRAAMEHTREALGVISTLCDEMGTIGSVANRGTPVLDGRLPVRALLASLQEAIAVDAPSWRGSLESDRSVATNGTGDLVRAVAALARMAFKDAASAPRVARVETGAEALTILIGGDPAVDALPGGPGSEEAVDVPVVRGGFGLSLMWAAFVLEQHRVRTWHHATGRGAVGLLFPLVNA